MSRIAAAFSSLAGHKALIPYITAGDPHPDITVDLMHGLVEAGADIIELGVPFSDPTADGPVIQHAAERALRHGVGLRNVLEMVSTFRQTDNKTPVVLMGYLNPVHAMGYAVFAKAAKSAGVDGVVTVDCPPEESEELSTVLKQEGIDIIYLLAPTTQPERIAQIARQASGYVYYVSLKGVTGAANLDVAEVARKISILREQITLPIGVGFGIRDAQTAHDVAQVADAVVVGSRLVSELASVPLDEAKTRLKQVVAELKAGIAS